MPFHFADSFDYFAALLIMPHYYADIDFSLFAFVIFAGHCR